MYQSFLSPCGRRELDYIKAAWEDVEEEVVCNSHKMLAQSCSHCMREYFLNMLSLAWRQMGCILSHPLSLASV